MSWFREPQGPTERELAMCDLFRSGKTLQAIGDVYGITRERVRQLIGRHGLSGMDGGQHAKVTPKKMADIVARASRKRARDNYRYETYFGCSAERFTGLTGEVWTWTYYKRSHGVASHPGNAYISQVRNAKSRGIAWNLSFPEWWGIWHDSGKWELRGRGEGYCMARYGDSGGYEAGNVYICTIGQNFSDSYLVHPWRERFPNVSERDELGLTPAQRRVYDLRIQGLTAPRIAELIGGGESNVRSHLQQIRKVRPLPGFDRRGRMVGA